MFREDDIGSRVWRVYLAVGILAVGAYLLLPYPAVKDLIFYTAVALSAVAAVVAGTQINRPDRPLIWHLFVAGLLLLIVADTMFSIYEHVLGTEPFPSLADVLYLSGYLPITASLLVLIRRRTPGGDRASFLNAAIITVSLGIVAWVLLVAPYVWNPSLSLLDRSVLIAYPLADVLLLAVLARFMFAPNALTTTYYLLVLGLTTMLICDVAFAATELAGTFESGGLIDAGFLLSYVLWGASALHPSMRMLSEPTAPDRKVKFSRKRLAVLVAGFLVAQTIVVIQAARGELIDVLVVVGSLILLVSLIVVRISDVLRTLMRTLDEHKQAEEALRESEERLRSLADATFEGILISDQGKIMEANEAILNMFGYKLEEVVGRSALEFIAPEYRAQVQRNILSGSEEPYEIVSLRKDGTPLELEVRGKAFLYQGRSVRVTAVRDITRRKAIERQLQHQAFHDPLTDLPNRALFMDRLEQSLTRLSRRESKVAVLFMDLDNFKVINDSLGHATGDQLLIAVAERLSRCLRPGDTAARLGGDEFTVLLEEVAHPSEAIQVAERIAEALKTFFIIEGQELFITTSIGVALGDSPEDQPGELLRKADLAMHWAKSEGKNLYEVFHPVMNLQILERLALENDLRRAIERNELRVYYQPYMLLDNGLQQHTSEGTPARLAQSNIPALRIVGMEALVRWEHPERGLMLPSKFIPIAEESGLIVYIGQWVLEEACRQAKVWQEQYPSDPPLMISVNLSLRQLQYPKLVQEIARTLQETGLDPHTMVLEITESIAMKDTESTVALLQELKDLGIRLAIDDLGTGHSSLSYLIKRFGINFVKLDRSFVGELGKDAEHKVILSAMIDLSHALNLKVVAEGVETREQLAQLWSLGCDIAQGNYFSEPLSSEAAGALLATYVHQ